MKYVGLLFNLTYLPLEVIISMIMYFPIEYSEPFWLIMVYEEMHYHKNIYFKEEVSESVQNQVHTIDYNGGTQIPTFS